MAGAETVSPLIEDRADLIEAFARGAKSKAEWRIGTEHEKHVFYRSPLSPVPYAGANGVEALLLAMAAKSGWTAECDNGKVIGLRDKASGGAISLEPGGQFELSGAPLATVHATATEFTDHLRLAKSIADPLGIGFLGLGVTPLWSVAQIGGMPKSRYAIMKPHMERMGRLGTSMMFRSATVQTNLDFSSEADMVKKLRVSLALQPVATALFANSPFVDGKPSGYLSFRSHIWTDTDPSRTGILPFAFEAGMGFERYADYALDVPMYFVIRNGRYINCAGESFRAFLAGSLKQLPGEKPTLKDWEDHISTAFPEVRLKQFLEMRGADMGSAAHVTALAAFWTGLLYDQNGLDAAWDLVKGWTGEERQHLRNAVPVRALATPFREGTVIDIAREALAIATAGLTNRGVRNASGENETVYLAPLEKTLRLGKTQAELWLEKYEGEWGGDLTRIFGAAAL